MALVEILSNFTGSLFSPALFFAIAVFIGLLISAIITIGVVFYREGKSWNLTIRVHSENPEINGINITSAIIPAKRIRTKEGKEVFFFKRPILGSYVCPALTTYTRPNTYDIIVTQDRDIFCVEKIESIDKKRKQMGIGINYPSIVYDFHDLKKYNDELSKSKNWDKWKTIAKISGYLFLFALIIVSIVLIGNYYVESKTLDLQINENNVKLMEIQNKNSERMQEILKIVQEVIPKLKNNPS